MRTTVTLDSDTEQIVRERMRAESVSFKRALNDAIRDGATGAADEQPYLMPVFDMGVPTVDLTKANRLASELEDAEVLRTMRHRS